MTTDARVLLVDSDVRSRRLLEMGLKKEGYAVQSVTSVADAMSVLNGGDVALVVSEIVLDDGDGFELLTQMKDDASLARVPFVFATESKDASDKARGFDLGAGAVLTKPVRIRELVARVGLLIDEAREDEPTMGERTGRLTDAGALELLNDIEVEEQTGALRVVYGRITVTAYFERGRIVDAVSGRVRGASAIDRLFTLPDGDWTLILTDEVDRESTIDASTSEVVADAMAWAESWDNAARGVPDLDGVYDVEYRSFVSSVGELPPEVNQVVRTFDGLRTLREAIVENELDDVTALGLVPKLMEAGTLVPVSGAAPSSAEDDAFEKLRITGAMKALDADAVPRSTGAVPAVDSSADADGSAPSPETKADEEAAAKAAELAKVEAEMAELEARRAKEREDAERRADEVRREADLLAAQLREEAERRATELSEAEADLARRRAKLTGELPAVTSAESDASSGDMAAMRDAEMAEIEAARATADAAEPARSEDLAAAVEAEKEAMRRDASSTGSTTDKLAAVTGPVTGTQPAVPRSAIEPVESADAPVTAAGAADTNEREALDDSFFTSSTPAAPEEDLFAEPETSGPSSTVWAIIAVLVLGGLFLVLINGSAGDDEVDAPVETESEAPADAEGSSDPVDEPTEPVEEPPSEEELARIALEEARTNAAIEADFDSEWIRSKARDLAQAIAESIADEEATSTTAAPSDGTRDTSRDTTSDREPEPSGDAERDMRVCANTYSGGNYSDTIAACEQALRSNPGDTTGFLYLGRAHYELGNTDQAIRYLDRVLRNDPSNRNALITVGAAKQELGDIEGARAAYERYVEYYPDSRRAEEVRRILETL